MPKFYAGLLDFVGDTFTVQRLAINADTATLEAKLTWNGAPWSFQASAKAMKTASDTFVFRAHCRDLSSGQPGCAALTESTLRIQVKFEVGELEVDGMWQENDDPKQYEIGGLLEEVTLGR